MTIFKRSIFPVLKETLADKRVVVLTGMRRVGKTTTLHWLLDQVDSVNKIFIDLERLDQRAVFQEPNYDLVLNSLQNQGMDITLPMTVALDEVQYVPNLPSVVKYLFDHYGIKFLLSGSSSFYLKNLFSESMAGRKVVHEMFPLGFGEFLTFRDVPFRPRHGLEDHIFDLHEFERLNGYYAEFIKYGGLPSVVLEQKTESKLEILRDIFSSYMNVDVKALADFRKLNELKTLMSVLALRIGNRLDYSKLSKIIGISRPTLGEYLEFLEKTYMIVQLPAAAGADRAAALGKKLYFRDNGIASILAHPGEGALFENAIFNQLRTKGELTYLAKSSDYEVDFILSPGSEPPAALEVKYHPLLSDRQRLERIANQNGFSRSWVVGREPTPGFVKFLWGGLFF